MVDSNDPLEQSLRSKLLELSQALLDSKERSVAIERALTEEQRLRGEGEVRLRECESVIQELQGQIEVNKQTMEGGQRSGTACVRGCWGGGLAPGVSHGSMAPVSSSVALASSCTMHQIRSSTDACSHRDR